MTNNQSIKTTLLSPPLLRDNVTMPWNFDRFHDRTESLKSKTMRSGLDCRRSRLFTIPLDIFENCLLGYLGEMLSSILGLAKH